MDKNETYRKQKNFRQCCIEFSRNHKILAINETLIKFTCYKLPHYGITFNLNSEKKVQLKPRLDNTFSYREAAEIIGRYYTYETETKTIIEFVSHDGFTYVTTDSRIFDEFKRCGYREKM